MPRQPKAGKFIVVEAVEGWAAVNTDLIEEVSFVTPMIAGLLDSAVYLRLRTAGSHIDIADTEEQSRVLSALRIEELAQEEASV